MRLYLKIVGALAVALSISPSFAEKPKGYTYLALGDSIPFGFDPTEIKGGALPKPHRFTGYPEIVAKYGKLEHVNASCPGETSSSFVILSIPPRDTPDNGCNGRGPDNQEPFKTSIGLHASYAGSQLEFALAQIQANPQIDLITISIGGNDLSLLQKDCLTKSPQDFEGCVRAELPGVLGLYAKNLGRILGDIRAVPPAASYKGRIVLLTNYSPDPAFDIAIIALNDTMKFVGNAFGATPADGFEAFKLISDKFGGGNACAAGLLVRLSPTLCDIHPSEDGQKLLAATILSALEKDKKR